MDILYLLAAQTAKSSGDHIRGIIAIIGIVLLIIVAVILGSKSGKKKAAKLIASLQESHPFKESYKNAHITTDGLLIIESANTEKVFDTSVLANANNNNKGYIAYAYKLSDISYVCPYVHSVRYVNKYGHGNQHTDTFVFSVLNSNLAPLVPESLAKKEISKSTLKKVANSDLINGGGYKDDHDLKEVIAMIHRNAPSIQTVDYEKVKEANK